MGDRRCLSIVQWKRVVVDLETLASTSGGGAIADALRRLLEAIHPSSERRPPIGILRQRLDDVLPSASAELLAALVPALVATAEELARARHKVLARLLLVDALRAVTGDPHDIAFDVAPGSWRDKALASPSRRPALAALAGQAARLIAL